MTESLHVTPAQVLLAQLAVELTEEAGETPDDALKAIAAVNPEGPEGRPVHEHDARPQVESHAQTQSGPLTPPEVARRRHVTSPIDVAPPVGQREGPTEAEEKEIDARLRANRERENQQRQRGRDTEERGQELGGRE